MNSSNNILIFSNENFGDIRVIMKDERPWFVAKDEVRSPVWMVSASIFSMPSSPTIFRQRVIDVGWMGILCSKYFMP